MSTTVVYNGVTLENVTTRQWDEMIWYDDSGTDAVGTKISMTFEGIIHVQSFAGLLTQAPAYVSHTPSPSGTAPSLFVEVAKRLEEPRKKLLVFFGDTIVLQALPPASMHHDSDTDNGPKPRAVKLVHVVSDKVLKITFSIEVAKIRCVNPSRPPSDPVISNRWSLGEDIDSNKFTTRTIRGRLKLAHANFPAHAYKGLVIPGRERGFKRERISFQVDASGLNCDYEVIDKQVHTAAPWPATDLAVSHVESTADGVNFMSEIAVRLTGAPDADKRQLLTRAVQIADAKLDLLARLNTSNYYIEHAALIDNTGPENTVEARFRVRHNYGTDQRELVSHILPTNIGLPLSLPSVAGQPGPYTPVISEFPQLYGHDPHGAARTPAALFLLHCYLQSPCDQKHDIAKFDDAAALSKDKSKEDYATEFRAERVSNLRTESLDKYDEGHKVKSYTYSRVESDYRLRNARTQMPIAKKLGKGNQNEDTCAIFSLAKPVSQRIIRVDAERIDEWPEIPPPDDTYTDGTLRATLLSHTITGLPPTLSADGRKKLYRVVGLYRYALNRPPRRDEEVKLSKAVFTNLPETETKLKAAKVYKGKL